MKRTHVFPNEIDKTALKLNDIFLFVKRGSYSIPYEVKANVSVLYYYRHISCPSIF